MLSPVKQAHAGASEEPRNAEEEARDALARGETRAAMAILVRGFGPAVFRYCRTMMGNETDAEDLLQITFLHLQRSLASLPPNPAMPGWLLGIARHRCLDKLRSDRRRRWADPDELDTIVSERIDVPAAFSGREAARAIEDCLDELDARTRAVVVLRLQDHLSYDQIAAATGDRAATLRVRVSRTLPVLRRCLESKGVEL